MTRGGKREGSGRPPGTDKIKRTYRVTEEEDQIIKRWLKKRRNKN